MWLFLCSQQSERYLRANKWYGCCCNFGCIYAWFPGNWILSGVGFNTSCISVNAIAAYIGLKRCKELLFLHSFSGFDYISSFYSVRKVEFWDGWLKNSVFSETFLSYSNRPTLSLAEENLKVIESFVVLLCVTESDILSSVHKAT